MSSSNSTRALLAGVLSMTFAVLLTPVANAVEGAFDVAVDRASIMRAPEGTATIIIGNPLIADATTQRNGVLVITGKSFGSTNMMLLDAKGEVLSETLINVRRPVDNTVVVQKGSKRESYACNPRCEPVLSIGDGAETFGQTASQITQRSGLSSSRGE